MDHYIKDLFITSYQFALNNKQFIPLCYIEHHHEPEIDVLEGVLLLQKIWFDGYFHKPGTNHELLSSNTNYKTITFKDGYKFANN